MLFFLIILIGTHISFVFYPIFVIFNTLFFPILISGILYYITFPFVNWMQNRRIPRSFAIIILYGLLVGLLALLFILLGPVLQREITKLLEEAPKIIEDVQGLLLAVEQLDILPRIWEQEAINLENLASWLSYLVRSSFSLIVENITLVAERLTNFLIIMLLIPFILFYMLKEGHKLPGIITRYIPEKHKKNILHTLSDMNEAISSYIQGIFIVCIFVGILVYIGFLIIGLDYPLVLALFAMITNVIPFLGPFIGTIPGVIVGALDSPAMMFKVIVVVIVVQQIESLVISPQVMGRKLSISPLTIILLIMVAGRMGGLLGMILAVPSYKILKIVVTHIYLLVQSNKKTANQPASLDSD